jgi:hypothetical protein
VGGDLRQAIPEDVAICTWLRTPLEQGGVRFALVDTAKRFSVENETYDGSFGFHGRKTLRINHENERFRACFSTYPDYSL